VRYALQTFLHTSQCHRLGRQTKTIVSTAAGISQAKPSTPVMTADMPVVIVSDALAAVVPVVTIAESSRSVGITITTKAMIPNAACPAVRLTLSRLPQCGHHAPCMSRFRCIGSPQPGQLAARGETGAPHAGHLSNESSDIGDLRSVRGGARPCGQVSPTSVARPELDAGDREPTRANGGRGCPAGDAGVEKWAA
jgi:hypothetical protein